MGCSFLLYREYPFFCMKIHMLFPKCVTGLKWKSDFFQKSDIQGAQKKETVRKK